MIYDRAKFFGMYRTVFGSLRSQSQVDGIEALLALMEADPWPDIRDEAYFLATVKHETADFVHLKELGGEAYFTRMYDITGDRPDKARELGNLTPGDGARYAGRGPGHLTGKANYRKMGEVFGVDLVANPELAATWELGGKILRYGMVHGAFTGIKLSDYPPGDYRNRRRIINADVAKNGDKIANDARGFEGILRTARTAADAVVGPVDVGSRDEYERLAAAVRKALADLQAALDGKAA